MSSDMDDSITFIFINIRFISLSTCKYMSPSISAVFPHSYTIYEGYLAWRGCNN